MVHVPFGCSVSGCSTQDLDLSVDTWPFPVRFGPRSGHLVPTGLLEVRLLICNVHYLSLA
jgi:hypothetical protein